MGEPVDPVDESNPDAALIEACLAGDARALEDLFERHRRLVHHAVRTVLARAGAAPDEDLAEEAFARVFATLCENGMKVLRSFRGRSRLATFIVVVARRVAIKTLEDRRPRAERGRRVAADAIAEPPTAEPGPAERAVHEEERGIVRGALDALPARDGLVLRLFYESGLGHREIGAILKVPVTHVGQILARARERLRVRLDRAGLGVDSTESGS